LSYRNISGREHFAPALLEKTRLRELQNRCDEQAQASANQRPIPRPRDIPACPQ